MFSVTNGESRSIRVHSNERTIFMDPHLYEAAQKGNLDALSKKMEEIGTSQLTPNKNTILHVLAQFSDSRECASEILKKNGSLLCQVNSDGETVLHIAARNGNKNVGEEMITFAKPSNEDLEAGGRGEALKKLLSWRNRNGDTALHEAIRNNRPSMVNLMIKEDPEIANIVNNALETPFFLAVDKNLSTCAAYMMDMVHYRSSLPAYGGPKGRTALHAAALHNLERVSEWLLEKHPTIVREVDDRGWSALHYAALGGSKEVAEELLKADKSIAYIVAENDNNMTALHIATWQGKVKIMEEILKCCPDCWEMVTGDGQNILHLSVKFEQQEAFNFIMKKPWVDKLINQKDEEGNTPLHVYAATFDFDGRNLVKHRQAEKNAVNKKYMTPLDVIKFSDVYSTRKFDVAKELKANGAKSDAWNFAIHLSQQSQMMKDYSETRRKADIMDDSKLADTHIVVAALITTVAFAAGFTIPGGYDGNDGPNEGLAVLSRKMNFKAFIITDTLAMVCSVSAVFLHFIAITFRTYNYKIETPRFAPLLLIMVAMSAMLIAFMTGLITVLEHSPGLKVAVRVICIFCFSVFYFSVRRVSKGL